MMIGCLRNESPMEGQGRYNNIEGVGLTLRDRKAILLICHGKPGKVLVRMERCLRSTAIGAGGGGMDGWID